MGKISYGLRPEQLCAVLGNWEVESGLDPTAVETVFDEPFMIGNTKQQATRFDFITDYNWSDAKAKESPTEETAWRLGNAESSEASTSTVKYFDKYKSIYKAGVGLAQWTDVRDSSDPNWKFDIKNPGRNTKLMTYYSFIIYRRN